MKRHIFVSQRRNGIFRRDEAFPGARLCTPRQVGTQAHAGDHVWLMTAVDEWLELVGRLVKRGAIPVVLSHRPEAMQAFEALNAGARGYTHALSAPALLKQVALATENQGLWVWPGLMPQVVGAAYRMLRWDNRASSPTLACLTARERDVALAVAAGHSNKEVAHKLTISERTVKAHLGAVFRKLHLRDRMQLVLSLSEQGADIY